MKRYQVFLFFYVGAPVLLVARLLQRFYMIDEATGFFRDGFSAVGSVVTGAFLVFIVAAWLLCRLSRPQERCLPERSLPMSVGAFTAAGFLLLAALIQLLTERGAASLLVALASAVFAGCLAWRGVALLGKAPHLPLLAPVGTVYCLIRLVVRFAGYAGEVTVSDSLFDILTMCLLLLFFNAEGKLLVGDKSEKLPSSFYAWGLSGALFCLSGFLPSAVDLLLKKSFVLRGGLLPDLSYIGFAVYLLIALHTAQKPTPSTESA